MDSRPDTLADLAAHAVRGSLSPVSRHQLRQTIRQLLDVAWAVVSVPEIDDAIEALDEVVDIRRDGVGRYYTAEMARSLSEVETFLAEARRHAQILAETEGSAASENRRRQLERIFGRPLLTSDDERELAERIRRGDPNARNIMVEANTRLASSLSQRWAGRSTPALDSEDMFQEACLGLVRAAEKFDGRRGFKFSTYATWWIRQAITRAIGDKSRTVRLPIHVGERLGKLAAAERDLYRRSGREPSVAAIAQNLAWPSELVVETRGADVATIPLESVRGLNDICDRTERLVEETVVALVSDEHFRSILGALDPRERNVLDLRLGLEDGDGLTLEEIGSRLGVTRERVRQIEKGALKKLKALLV